MFILRISSIFMFLLFISSQTIDDYHSSKEKMIIYQYLFSFFFILLVFWIVLYIYYISTVMSTIKSPVKSISYKSTLLFSNRRFLSMFKSIFFYISINFILRFRKKLIVNPLICTFKTFICTFRTSIRTIQRNIKMSIRILNMIFTILFFLEHRRALTRERRNIC